MPTADPIEKITLNAKPSLVLFFVIDCSASMSTGGRINSVNLAIREALPIVKSAGSANADVKIAVLTFSNGAKWMCNEPVAANDFVWSDISAGGYTDFGAACDELCDMLSQKKFITPDNGHKKPVIILLTDGLPTDVDVWPAALERLKANIWFKNSYKIAFAIDGADEDMLLDFVGRPEGVRKIDDPQKLKEMLKGIAIAFVKIRSRSIPIDTNAAAGNRDKAAESGLHKTIGDTIEEVDNNYATGKTGSFGWDNSDDWD